MNQKDLFNERDFIFQVLGDIESILSDPPEGRLSINNERGYIRCYRTTMSDSSDNSTKRIYIPNSEINTACDLAQYEHAKKIYPQVKKFYTSLDNICQLILTNNPYNAHENLSDARKAFTQPFLENDNEFIISWLNEPAAVTNSFEIAHPFECENGILVRSKSEKFIADKLFAKAIPFKFEFPVKINGTFYFPDFTILNIYTREVIYWEHFGLVDDEKYRNEMIKKIRLYNAAGLKLIITMESSQQPFNPGQIEGILIANGLI